MPFTSSSTLIEMLPILDETKSCEWEEYDCKLSVENKVIGVTNCSHDNTYLFCANHTKVVEYNAIRLIPQKRYLCSQYDCFYPILDVKVTPV